MFLKQGQGTTRGGQGGARHSGRSGRVLFRKLPPTTIESPAWLLKDRQKPFGNKRAGPSATRPPPCRGQPALLACADQKLSKNDCNVPQAAERVQAGSVAAEAAPGWCHSFLADQPPAPDAAVESIPNRGVLAVIQRARQAPIVVAHRRNAAGGPSQPLGDEPVRCRTAKEVPVISSAVISSGHARRHQDATEAPHSSGASS